MKRKYERRRPGSALILVVVLTSLLAIVGIMFVLTARIDNMSTSSVVENKELNFAVDSVVAKIFEVLARDVPGTRDPIDPNNIRAEYHDYPYHRLDPGPDDTLGTRDDSIFDPGPDENYRETDDNILVTGFYDDIWLASLEPEVVDYLETPVKQTDDLIGFRHISDLYGRLAYLFYDSFDYRTNRLKDDVLDIDDERVSFRNLRARIISPSAAIVREGEKADADGDGVADSRWVILPDMKTHKGDDIYAAIRIVDNAAMLNVNTAFMNTTNIIQTDPLFDANTVDGSNQTQINLIELSTWGNNGTLAQAADKLQFFRCGQGREITRILPEYLWNVVWKYNRPAGAYTPFDISDELKMRNRYILNYNKMTSRIERLWYSAYDSGIAVPRDGSQGTINTNPDIWFLYANNSSLDPCDYDFRHISTTYNMDRIINPAGWKMFNVNDHNDFIDPPDRAAQSLYRNLRGTIDPTLPAETQEALNRTYGQLAVNIVDFADDDTFVTVLQAREYGRFYGFEAQPFITELGMIIDRQPWLPGARNYFAVELYNPFNAPINLEDFTLMVGEPTDINDLSTAACSIPLDGVLEPRQSVVIANDPAAFFLSADPCNLPLVITAPCLNFFGDCKPPRQLQPVEDRRDRPDKLKPPLHNCWTESYNLYLVRRVRQDSAYIYVDMQPTNSEWTLTSVERYLGRDMRDWHIVYQNLDILTNINTLGAVNTTNPANFIGHNFSLALPNPYHRTDHIDPVKRPPRRQQLITIGDIPQILTIGPGRDYARTVGRLLLFTPINREYEIRLNLQDPLYSNIFQYLTVFDPTKDGIDNDGDGVSNESLLPTLDNPLRTPEFKVPGRININTAPWFVIAQLPWVSPELARAIVAYRDKLDISTVDYTSRFYEIELFLAGLPYRVRQEHIREVPGFASIGELNLVIAGNREYRVTGFEPDGADLKGFPDLTTHGPALGDGIVDDYEERDLIFSRISNLVTVRSDVFTAYILVRIGRDGPQKRVIAILDRSDVYPSASESVGRVKLRSLHPVADPR